MLVSLQAAVSTWAPGSQQPQDFSPSFTAEDCDHAWQHRSPTKTPATTWAVQVIWESTATEVVPGAAAPFFAVKIPFWGQRITCHFYIIQENFDPLWSHPVDVIKFLWVPPGEQETLTWQWQHLLFSIKSFTPFLASLALCCRRIKIWMLRHSAHSGKSMKIIENQDDPTINWGDITSHLNHFTVKMPINRRPANCEVHGSISLELPSKKQPKA